MATYYIINRAHGVREKMLKLLKGMNDTIIKDSVELYKSYCPMIQMEMKRPKTTAEVMVKHSRVELNTSEVGDNVAVPFQWLTEGRGDPGNIFGVIIDRHENDMYIVRVKTGVISTRHSRNQFYFFFLSAFTN
ncbi:unnamed protein product [Lepeophtheirus salmonis]|uniref:(salmon louse) hypothetical protein n=1 Tax=Lepeophtheirus salmonis TaxID=72036 RepID=A0A7R8CVE8_LEPSM|nr:unnamed protein product [Lepeophtheirus salmonis]CAF2909922.1 unnamed protein product [Lepeophtheirus salmonis]